MSRPPDTTRSTPNGAAPPPGLDKETVEAIAERVAAKLAPAQATGLVTARVLAQRLSVSVDFVYEHAEELGVIRLGNGPKARLRFDIERAQHLRAEAAQRANGQPPKRKRQRPKPELPPGVPLIAGRRKR